MPDLSVYYLFQAALFYWSEYREKRSLREFDSIEQQETFLIQFHPSQNGE